MKKHGDKFAVQHLLPIPLLVPDGMVRKGAIGEGQKFSKEILEEFDSELNKQLTSAQKDWLLYGGTLPNSDTIEK